MSGGEMRYRVRPSGALSGAIRVPGDKSIGHRALIFAALAEGRSLLHDLPGGLDIRATKEALEALGVPISHTGEAIGVDGVGLSGLRMPGAPIDCGNSGTTLRLLAGVLSGQRFGTRLFGDASLSRRPMRRIVEPLRARGAHIAGTSGAADDELTPPLSIAPHIDGEELLGLEYEMPFASAQVKSALLLSGLYSRGPTALREPTVSRDHTERMMNALGMPVSTMGPVVVLDPEGWDPRWRGFDWTVPGDFSSAAFLLAAALVVPESSLVVEGLGLNPTRTGLLDVLRPMGARAGVEWKGAGAADEPIGDLRVTHGPLRAGRTGGELLTRMVDEVPALCALAATAAGVTEIRDAAELRVKESDRLAAMAEVLRAFGVPSEELHDGLIVRGGGALRGARVRSQGDHRVAMAATVLALAAEGESVIDDVACVETSFPGFDALLRSLGADVRPEGRGDEPSAGAGLGGEEVSP